MIILQLALQSKFLSACSYITFHEDMQPPPPLRFAIVANRGNSHRTSRTLSGPTASLPETCAEGDNLRILNLAAGDEMIAKPLRTVKIFKKNKLGLGRVVVRV